MRSSRIRAAAALAGFLAVLGACSSSPQYMTVNGTLEIAVQDYSEFQTTYLQAYTGHAQITITDPSGKVIAVTTADGQNANQLPASAGETLIYGWTAKVPEGLSFYGVSVTGVPGAPVQFTQAQMRQSPGVCIGDNCGG